VHHSFYKIGSDVSLSIRSRDDGCVVEVFCLTSRGQDHPGLVLGMDKMVCLLEITARMVFSHGSQSEIPVGDAVLLLDALCFVGCLPVFTLSNISEANSSCSLIWDRIGFVPVSLFRDGSRRTWFEAELFAFSRIGKLFSEILRKRGDVLLSRFTSLTPLCIEAMKLFWVHPAPDCRILSNREDSFSGCIKCAEYASNGQGGEL